MSNIVILTNFAQYPYHTYLSNMIRSALCQNNVFQLDINSKEYDHQCLAELNRLSPDIIITLDLSGFRFRTQTGENALNMLYTKNLNIIWGNKPEYAQLLNKKISLSMLFYDATGTDNKLTQIYPNLLYYKVANLITYCPTSTLSMRSDQENFLRIWNDFKQETLLF